MTWKEVAAGILAMPTRVLDEPAEVYPPGECPATARVLITELSVPRDVRIDAPVLLTGKKPERGG